MKPVEAVNRSKYFKNDLMKFILNFYIAFARWNDPQNKIYSVRK